MDSSFVEGLYAQLAEEYPRLVDVLGEYAARAELEASLGHLVTKSVLDPTDAEELLDRLILPQTGYVPFQHDIPDTRSGYDADGNYHVVWHGYTEEYLNYLQRGQSAPKGEGDGRI